MAKRTSLPRRGTRDQIVQALQGAGFRRGLTLAKAPAVDFTMVKAQDPIKYRAKGRKTFIGVATQRGYTVISYGPKD